MILLRIFLESFRFAWHAIVSNKLRTFLSLLGVTIGILAVITVFTIVDSLEKNVRDSINKLGSDVIYIQKWPWGASDDAIKVTPINFKSSSTNIKDFIFFLMIMP